MMTDKYNMLEERISAWGQSNDEITAIYMVGSRARADKSFDEFSDIDAVVFSTNPPFYFQNDEWLRDIGEVWTSFLFQTAGGDPEKLVLFDQGLQVDFLFRHVSDFESLIQSNKIPLGFQRGAKLLVDKTGNGQQLLPATTMAPNNPPINQDAFIQVVNMFGFACLYVAKQVLRGEMYIVNQRDKDCKQLLLQMIEWHAKALHGASYDTWHAGKFINEWADKVISDHLKLSFGDYDPTNSWKALMASFELFSRLSSEVAHIYSYTYPASLISNIQAWLEEQQASFELKAEKVAD